MVSLVGIAIPPSPEFALAVERTWADGNAFCVLDPRLPADEAERTLAALGADYVLDQHDLTKVAAKAQGLEPLQDGDALVMATGGSTGEPKAVVHTRQSVAASATATSAALGVDPHRDKWLACLPLSHIGGLSVVLRALHTDTPVEFHRGFDGSAVQRAAADGATLTSLVTRTLTQIDPAAFRSILIGGAAPPSDRADNVIATYGMTETGSGIVYDQTRLDGVELDIDESGEILVRGPMLFRGYRQPHDTPTNDTPTNDTPTNKTPTNDTPTNDTPTNKTLTDAGASDPLSPFTAAGWFRTGDIGRFGSSGELIVEGRRDDVIVTGAEKVWPSRVETLLRELPTVGEAVVVGEADSEWGQNVVAVITLTGDQQPSLAEVREHVKASLPAWYAPKRLIIRKSLPRAQSGKIQRRRIDLAE